MLGQLRFKHTTKLEWEYKCPRKKNEMNKTLNAATHFVQLNVMHFSESKSHELTHVRWGENEFGFSFCALEIM